MAYRFRYDLSKTIAISVVCRHGNVDDDDDDVNDDEDDIDDDDDDDDDDNDINLRL
jgi:hypothetical protein